MGHAAHKAGHAERQSFATIRALASIGGSSSASPRHSGRHISHNAESVSAEARHAQHGRVPSAIAEHAAKSATSKSSLSAGSDVAAVVDVRRMLLRELNSAPLTRREIRERNRRDSRKSNFMMAGAMVVLIGSAGALCGASAAGVFDRTPLAEAQVASQQILPADSSDVTGDAYDSSSSRSETRSESVDTSDSTSWDGQETMGQLKVVTLSSRNLTLPEGKQVADGIWRNNELFLADPSDVDVPDSVDHQTGDTGNSYPYGQCTWWAYVRRHQLGLPVGSYFGNAMSWAASARALGYSVDNNPQAGDIVVFAPGQAGASTTYGHVAIVEAVIGDKIVISEANSGGALGQATSRTLANIHDFTYIHS
ncbi:CHAP domain-containing protein [Pseudoscardovia radai]|uniref:CHAP domain-containing protein n=1 Tax=Pseudoscardovia radai TaxID=987066 RepID=UPI003992498F